MKVIYLDINTRENVCQKVLKNGPCVGIIGKRISIYCHFGKWQPFWYSIFL